MKLSFLKSVRRATTTLACLVLLSCLFTSERSAAQNQSSASLNGVVKDSSGAVLPGATVTLTSVETGILQTKETNGAGLYTFSNILPGAYTLEATHEGFRPNCGPISLSK